MGDMILSCHGFSKLDDLCNFVNRYKITKDKIQTILFKDGDVYKYVLIYWEGGAGNGN